LLLVTSFIYFLANGLDAPLAVDFGFKEELLGTIFAIAIVAAAIGNHFYPRLKNLFGKDKLLNLIFISTLLSAIFSPIFGLALGGIALVYRHFLYTTPDVIASDTVNRFVESKYRATTLSTFNMLHNVPYVLSAYLVGRAIDSSSASIVTMWVSIIFVALGMIMFLTRKLRLKLHTRQVN